ncbi:Intermediate filament protein [Chytridiales sp. JEL 0842]|nr:Intermediate filament protein [Chytridiales sp. JEL 0842]
MVPPAKSPDRVQTIDLPPTSGSPKRTGTMMNDALDAASEEGMKVDLPVSPTKPEAIPFVIKLDRRNETRSDGVTSTKDEEQVDNEDETTMVASQEADPLVSKLGSVQDQLLQSNHINWDPRVLASKAKKIWSQLPEPLKSKAPHVVILFLFSPRLFLLAVLVGLGFAAGWLIKNHVDVDSSLSQKQLAEERKQLETLLLTPRQSTTEKNSISTDAQAQVPSSIAPLHPSIRIHVETMSTYIVRDFISPWYNNLNHTRSPTFPHLVNTSIQSAFAQLSYLASQTNLTALTLRISAIVRTHVETWELFEESGMDLETFVETSSAGSVWRRTWGRDRILCILKDLGLLMVDKLLPQRESNSFALKELVGEILGSSVLMSVVEKFSDPDYINQKLLERLEKAEVEGEASNEVEVRGAVGGGGEQVYVKVVEARKIPPSSNTANNGSLYVSVSLGSQTLKTPKVTADSNPVWAQDFAFDWDPESEIKMEVYESRPLSIRDDKIGTSLVKLASLTPNKFNKQWVPLISTDTSGKTSPMGEILVEAIWVCTDLPEDPMSPLPQPPPGPPPSFLMSEQADKEPAFKVQKALEDSEQLEPFLAFLQSRNLDSWVRVLLTIKTMEAVSGGMEDEVEMNKWVEEATGGGVEGGVNGCWRVLEGYWEEFQNPEKEVKDAGDIQDDSNEDMGKVEFVKKDENANTKKEEMGSVGSGLGFDMGELTLSTARDSLTRSEGMLGMTPERRASEEELLVGISGSSSSRPSSPPKSPVRKSTTNIDSEENSGDISASRPTPPSPPPSNPQIASIQSELSALRTQIQTLTSTLQLAPPSDIEHLLERKMELMERVSNLTDLLAELEEESALQRRRQSGSSSPPVPRKRSPQVLDMRNFNVYVDLPHDSKGGGNIRLLVSVENSRSGETVRQSERTLQEFTAAFQQLSAKFPQVRKTPFPIGKGLEAEIGVLPLEVRQGLAGGLEIWLRSMLSDPEISASSILTEFLGFKTQESMISFKDPFHPSAILEAVGGDLLLNAAGNAGDQIGKQMFGVFKSAGSVLRKAAVNTGNVVNTMGNSVNSTLNTVGNAAAQGISNMVTTSVTQLNQTTAQVGSRLSITSGGAPAARGNSIRGFSSTSTPGSRSTSPSKQDPTTTSSKLRRSSSFLNATTSATKKAIEPRTSSIPTPPPSSQPLTTPLIPPAHLPLILDSLFTTLSSVFPLSSDAWIRKSGLQVFKSLLRSTSGRLSTILQTKLSQHLSPAGISSLASKLVDSLWPNGVFVTKTPEALEQQAKERERPRSDDEKHETKIQAKRKLLGTASMGVGTLRTLVGGYNTSAGLTRVFNMLQRRELNRGLLCAILEAVVAGLLEG